MIISINLLEFLKVKKSWFYGEKLLLPVNYEFLEKGDLNLPLIHVKRGADGGYKQITQMIEKGEIGIVFFFRDPEIVQSYHNDITSLLNICDLNNIPLSTNQAGAELLIIGKIRMEAAEKVQSKFS